MGWQKLNDSAMKALEGMNIAHAEIVNLKNDNLGECIRLQTECDHVIKIATNEYGYMLISIENLHITGAIS